MLNEYQESNQQQFEQAQNNVQYLKLQNIDESTHNSTTKPQFRKTIKENVSMKFQKIKNQNINHGKNYYMNMAKNISFQSERSFQNKNHHYNQYDDQDGRSSLGFYYENKHNVDLVYKKSRNIGTEWIGQRQYFTSLFASPQLIQKTFSKSLFGKLNDSEQQDTAINPHQYVLDKNTLNSSLSFDSDFQSGNLFAAYKIGILQYDLLLQNDINTKGNTQWFYFRIKNPPQNKIITINIVNFRKSDSLFNYGMLPCIYSSQAQKYTNQRWLRKGSKVKYFRNNHQIQNSRKYYYTLTFTILAEYANDTLKIAQCYPYTVSDLHNFFGQIEKINYKKDKCHKVTVMNKTLGGNKIQSLVIKQCNPKIKNNDLRPLIILIARQHPGQTPGSFMMEGLLEYFLSKDKQPQFIRKNYQIRAIPMVNPDGVQVGNYRTNLYGVDLNRRWDCSTKQKQVNKDQRQNRINAQASQAIHIKKYLAAISKGRQIAYIIDFHGHSRKLYSFFYGNSYPQSPLDVKIFPYICSKITSMISYEDSTFNVQEQKRSTARVQFLMNYKALNIYTFQASFFGYINKRKEKKHYTIENYKNLGMVIGKAIYLCEKRKQESQIETKQKLLYEKLFKELSSNAYLTKAGENQDSGSQTCPQQCEIQQFQKGLLEQDCVYQQEQTKRLSTASKVNRQKFRHQNISSAKQPQKTLRQMQVLDIARVNSIFPNDILALVPNTFYLKSSKIPKKETKNVQIQTESCQIIKIYESCKIGEASFFDLSLREKIGESKSVIFQRTKAKSTGDVFPVNSSIQNKNSLVQTTLKNFSTLFVNRSKSIHEKHLYENARHLSALKKSTDIRRNFKKVLTEHQLSKPKSQLLKNQSLLSVRRVHKYVQTTISFQKDVIVKNESLSINKSQQKNISHHASTVQKQDLEGQSLTESKFIFESPSKLSRQSNIQNPSKFWTIQSKRKSLGVEPRQFNTPLTRSQFRKTIAGDTKEVVRNNSNNINEKIDKNQKLMQNWRIKKKSLI